MSQCVWATGDRTSSFRTTGIRPRAHDGLPRRSRDRVRRESLHFRRAFNGFCVGGRGICPTCSRLGRRELKWVTSNEGPGTNLSSLISLPPSSSRPDGGDRFSAISKWLRLMMSHSSSTAAHGRHPTGQVCGAYEDLQDIKQLLAKATEQYNGKLVLNISNPSATIRSLAIKAYNYLRFRGRRKSMYLRLFAHNRLDAERYTDIIHFFLNYFNILY